MIVCNLKFILSGSYESLSYCLHIAFIYALYLLDILTLQAKINYQGGIAMNTTKNTFRFHFFLATILLIAFCTTGCSTPTKSSLSSAQPEETALPTQSTVSIETNIENTASVYEQQKKDGTTVYSLDGGNTWINQEDFEKEYPTHNIEWWTYDEYANYIEQQKITLQEMVDNHVTGYTDNRGDFVWTQELADETIKKYEQDLEKIKNGVKISKSIEGLDDDCGYESYSLDPKSTPATTFEISLPDGTTKQFSGKDKVEVYELIEDYCKLQIKEGSLTQEEANKILDELK